MVAEHADKGCNKHSYCGLRSRKPWQRQEHKEGHSSHLQAGEKLLFATTTGPSVPGSQAVQSRGVGCTPGRQPDCCQSTTHWLLFSKMQYEGEEDLPLIMQLVDNELSEPYSIFTYR